MKFVIIMPIASPWSRNFAQQISKQGHDVFVIDPSAKKNSDSYLNDDDIFQKDNINSFLNSVSGYIINRSKLGYLVGMVKSIFVIRKTARQFNPDALIVLYGGLWGALAYMSRIRPYFIYIVGSDILVSGKIKQWINRLTLNSSEFVFSNGKHLARKANQIANKAKIENLYLGIDSDKFTPLDKNNSGPIQIICTRGFKEIYNNQYIIDCLSKIDFSKLPETKLVFTSAGPLLENIKEYTSTIQNIAFKENIVFLGGVSDFELLSYLQNSQIYISTSKSDGASTSLMEALSCGLYPILSDIPANREWINNENGALISLEDAETVAEKIQDIILNIEQLENVKKQNRNMILNIANAKKNIGVFTEKIENIILHE